MFDTIRLYKRGYLGKDFRIKESLFNKIYDVDNELSSYVNQFDDLVRVSFDKYKKGLIISFSAQKVANGTQLVNLKISDCDKLFDNLYRILSDAVSVDLEDMSVSRLDITSNILVESKVKYYINTLQSKFRKRLNYRTDFYKDESFTIFNKSRRIVFYDKVKEQKDKNLDVVNMNILRYEIQNKKKRDIKTLLKRDFTFKELFSESVFIDCVKIQKHYFSEFFTNGGHFSFFESERALIEALKLKFSNRNLIKNYIVKSYLDKSKVNYNDLEMLFSEHYSARGLKKALDEIKEIEFLTYNTDYSILMEVERKINELYKYVI